MSEFNPTCSKLSQVTEENPCIHCGRKDGWCYTIGNLSVCKKKAEPAQGWRRTSKKDKDGDYFYAPETKMETKSSRPADTKHYDYTGVDGNPRIRVTVKRTGNGAEKRVWQSYWGGMCWVSAKDFNQLDKEQYQESVTWYRYADIKQAIEQGKPIFIVEGEGVADALWELGIAATTTIGGSGKYRRYGLTYKQDLAGASVIVLCPDRDEPGLKHMEDISKDFPQAKWLYAPPHDFYWTNLPKSQGLDVKDWIESGATADDILQAIEDRRVVVDSFTRSLDVEVERERPAKSEMKQAFNLIQSRWGDRLAWNSLKKIVELDGEKLSIDRLKLRVAKDFDIDLGKEDAKEIVVELALYNSYSPVVRYLDSLSYSRKESPSEFLDGLASRYLGTNDPLHAILLKKTLIAAVARAYSPGEKVDTICILQGMQGALKSTFWSVLASKDFFTDDISSGSEKDEVMKLSQYWLLEYAEFETAYRKKEVSALKAFLSRQKDSIRLPYAKDIEDVFRPSIFVGTTNKTEFLHDPTGERRYWVIPVWVKKINKALLLRERDAIWAAAVQCYHSGEIWHLDDDEEDLLKNTSGVFQASDSWEPAIAKYLSGRDYTTPADVLTECLLFDLNRIQKSDEMRVTQILRRLEWDKNPKQRRINGQQVRVWQPINQLQPVYEVVTVSDVCTAIDTAISTTVTTPKSENPEVVTPSNPYTASNTSDSTPATITKVVTEVVTHSKPDIASDSEQVSPPFSKINQNFSEEVEEQNISSHQDSEKLLSKKVVTVVTEPKTLSQSTFSAVTTSCHNPVSQPKTPKVEFDAAAHSRTMLELLQEENAEEWIDELMKDWSNRQKIQVRSQLSPEQYQAVKAALHKFNSDKYSCAPTPDDVVGEVNNESTTTPSPSLSSTVDEANNQFVAAITSSLTTPQVSEVKHQESIVNSNLEEITQLPKIGQWVRLNDSKDKDLYQVVALSPSKGKVELESERGAMGHYSAKQFTVLTKREIVELGLLTTKLRPWFKLE